MLLKYVARLKYGDALPSSDDERTGDVKVYGSNGPYSSFARSNTASPVIVIGRKGSYGKLNWSGKPVFASDTTFFIDPTTTDAHLRWLYYVLHTLNLDVGSNEAAVPGLNRDTVYQRRVLLPPVNEQRAIAHFLDRETAKIDRLIDCKRRLLEVLAERRQALITLAVTKGLDPDKPMKNSGVEWLGEIPEHWKSHKLKYCTSKIGSGKTPRGGAEVYVDDGILFIRSQNVYFDGLRLADVVFIDAGTDNEMASTRVMPNDVLLNITGASIGRCAHVPNVFGAANVNQHVCIVRPRRDLIDSRFLHLVMSSEVVQRQIFSNETGVSREGLNFEQISNLWIAIPVSFTEQLRIVEHANMQLGKIASLQSQIVHMIDRLQERRFALINEAVTGKLKVI